MNRARLRRSASTAVVAAHLLLAAAMLLGALERHPAGEPLREITGSWRVQPQEPGCAGPGTTHVDRAGAPTERDCPSCLHRLQSRGTGLAAAPVLVALPAVSAQRPTDVPFADAGERLPLAARGPPSLPG